MQTIARGVRILALAATCTVASGAAWAADSGVTAVFEQPAAAVHRAAADALAVIGVAKLERDQPEILQGSRSRKFGVVVGSGGEVITVQLSELAPARTEVTVKTKKTFLGMAGQKVWNQPVIDEMTKLLAATPAAAEPLPATTPEATDTSAGMAPPEPEPEPESEPAKDPDPAQ